MKDNIVTAVDDALLLLMLLGEKDNLGLSELSRLSGMNKSKVYRLLCTLENRHFVQKNDNPVTYHLGHQLLSLGNCARQQIDYIQVADIEAERLRQRFDENIQLRIRDNDDVLQVLHKPSGQSLQVRSEAGNRRALGSGASGRVLLAYSPLDVQSHFTEKNPSLIQTLADIHTRGFAITRGELTAGIGAIATPIFTQNGDCIAALSISLPLSRFSDDKEKEMTEQLLQSALRISRQLGYIPNN
ncbi:MULTISPECIES: IclR family transcriptional regulator [Providencia]|uniref:IclR family transcriptional regulator n=1 Tax=Providencia TaxID=586 RepID=UPI001981352F|nr:MULTISPECIES: IclR family transcriptional regulator [Providencia]MBN4865159.1 IclR family transcriptional regulator [Providencia stuartii]MBN4874615.1 IclR family transcriptional regulator [Providencia stuartii]MBN4879172.1 IclR family transcriptional regulator [Providencia stuartii]MBN4883816.1 IclR family transcriptional regulator [Providencia stuartii]